MNLLTLPELSRTFESPWGKLLPTHEDKNKRSKRVAFKKAPFVWELAEGTGGSSVTEQSLSVRLSAFLCPNGQLGDDSTQNAAGNIRTASLALQKAQFSAATSKEAPVPKPLGR